MCVCVCGCGVGGRFIYPGGDLNLNGDSCHGGGPKLRSPWVQKGYNSYRMFFFIKNTESFL